MLEIPSSQISQDPIPPNLRAKRALRPKRSPKTGADGGTEEVALEIGFQETKDREFVPVDGTLLTVDGAVLIDVMMLMLMLFGS